MTGKKEAAHANVHGQQGTNTADSIALPIGRVDPEAHDHHPFLSPSSDPARGWLCPGSVWLKAALLRAGAELNSGSPAAEEGSRLHALAAMDREFWPRDVDGESARLAGRAQGFCESLRAREKVVLYTIREHRYRMMVRNVSVTWCRLDWAAVALRDGARHAIVVDHKFGRREPPQWFLRVQGGFYLSAFMAAVRARSGEFWGHSVREGTKFRMACDDPRTLRRSLLKIVRRIRRNPRTFRPGALQCEYCPCLPWCDAAAATARHAVQLPPELDSGAPAEAARRIELAQVAAAWADRVRKQATQLAAAGARFPGYRLEETPGNRVIADPVEAQAVWRQYGLPADAFAEVVRVPIGAYESSLAEVLYNAWKPQKTFQDGRKVTKALCKKIVSDEIARFVEREPARQVLRRER